MRAWKVKIVVLFILFLFSLTAYAAGFLGNWKGQSVDSLFEKLGQPNETLHLPNGNTVYTYVAVTKSAKQHSAGATKPTIFVGPNGQAYSAGVPEEDDTAQARCVAIFVINSQRVIIGTRFRGNC